MGRIFFELKPIFLGFSICSFTSPWNPPLKQNKQHEARFYKDEPTRKYLFSFSCLYFVSKRFLQRLVSLLIVLRPSVKDLSKSGGVWVFVEKASRTSFCLEEVWDLIEWSALDKNTTFVNCSEPFKQFLIDL